MCEFGLGICCTNGEGSVLKIINKRKLFRWLINWADRVNIWIEDVFNLNAKRKVLEAKQDLVSVEELENTIGKSLGIYND